MPLRLRQGQVWKDGNEFLRIVRLDRLEVGYKALKSLQTSEGTHHCVSKKAFCRRLKSAILITGEAGDSSLGALATRSMLRKPLA
jgi:hypothetical protein